MPAGDCICRGSMRPLNVEVFSRKRLLVTPKFEQLDRANGIGLVSIATYSHNTSKLLSPRLSAPLSCGSPRLNVCPRHGPNLSSNSTDMLRKVIGLQPTPPPSTALSARMSRSRHACSQNESRMSPEEKISALHYFWNYSGNRASIFSDNIH